MRLAAARGAPFRGRAQATCPRAMGSAALELGCARRLHSLPLHRARPCTLQVEAGKKENALVMARLRPRAAAAGAELCVGSWHGPVAFGPPAKVQMAVLVNVAAGTPTPDHAQIVPRSCQTVPGRARSRAPASAADAPCSYPCLARGQRTRCSSSPRVRRACWPATSTR